MSNIGWVLRDGSYVLGRIDLDAVSSGEAARKAWAARGRVMRGLGGAVAVHPKQAGSAIIAKILPASSGTQEIVLQNDEDARKAFASASTALKDAGWTLISKAGEDNEDWEKGEFSISLERFAARTPRVRVTKSRLHMAALVWKQDTSGVWHLTSEGARKAWETRRARGEGKKDDPKPAAPKPAEPKPARADFKVAGSKAVQSFVDSVKRNGGRYLEVDQVRQEGDGLTFDVRDFGNWQNPPDATDEEDYDWKVPTRETVAKLNSIAAQIERDHPQVKAGWTVQEKNWITFSVRPK